LNGGLTALLLSELPANALWKFEWEFLIWVLPERTTQPG